MQKLWLSVWFVLAFVSIGWAHEGHEHKIMGTISAVSANRLEVKATDGKTVTIALTDKTKLRWGKTTVVLADLKVGQRVVVSVGSGKEPLSATEVQISQPSSAARPDTKPATAAGVAKR